MNRRYCLLLVSCVFLVLATFGCRSEAADTGPVPDAPAATVAITDGGEPVVIPTQPFLPPDTSVQIAVAIAHFAFQFPWLAMVVGFLGSNRLWGKPASVAIHWLARKTKWTWDDRLVEVVELSPAWAWFWWLMDYVFSLKRYGPGTVVKVTRSGGVAPASVALALVLGLSWAGCATDPETVAFKTIASVQATVKTTVDAWADHVVARRAAIAKLPSEDQVGARTDLLTKEGRVIAALEKYKAAAAAAEAGLNAALSGGNAPAPAAMIGAATTYTTLVAELTR